MRSSLKLVPALLLGLILIGCPPEAPPGGSGKAPPPATDGSGTPPADGQTTTEPVGTQPAAGAEAPWTVIASPEVKQEIYPMLQPAETWPAPAALKPIADVPEDKRPDPSKVKALKDLVLFLVHPDLRPKDLDAAIGVDAQGRTFMRLGKEKAQGSASLDVRRVADDPKFDFPVFAMTLDDPASGAQTLERLQRRVKNVVTPDLGKEMSVEKFALQAQPNPKVNNEQGVAAMAMLDRDGFGGQFRYLYAWGTDKHLLVLLQEVPHMSLGDDGGQGPR
jgi:hypothetical protein